MPARMLIWLFSAGLTALMLEPAIRTPPRDGYPFSNYPMFSYPRPERPWIAAAIGVRKDGHTTLLTPSFIASAEPMQAVATLRRVFRRSRKDRKAHCQRIAERVQESSDDDFLDVVEIRLERRQYGLTAYFEGQTEPEKTTVMATCPVSRNPAP